MGREAERVLRAIATPQEAYNKKVERLGVLLKANKLSQDEYKRAVDQAKGSLDAAAKSGQAAFGESAVGAEKLRDGRRLHQRGDCHREKGTRRNRPGSEKRTAAKARESELSYGSLAEVSEGSPQVFKKNLAMARAIAAKAGMSENQAARLTFALNPPRGGRGGPVRGVLQGRRCAGPREAPARQPALRRAYGNRMSNEQVLDIAMKASEGSPARPPRCCPRPPARQRSPAWRASTKNNCLRRMPSMPRLWTPAAARRRAAPG